ncbi:MAG: hypothetical protein CM1200mP3_04140 [Chloroflexota bacterium]|nr:MAG: hypothetical protein CM1200mP3_04140 [Chloroflexota bacterium]
MLILFAVMLTRIDDFRNLTDNGQQLVGGCFDYCRYYSDSRHIDNIDRTNILSGIGIQEWGLFCFLIGLFPLKCFIGIVDSFDGSVVLVKRGERGD